MAELIDQIIAATPVSSRVAFALGVAETVLPSIAGDPEGSLIAREALDLAWRWEEGEPISGDALAEYIDSPTSKDLGSRELQYADPSMVSALIAITAAIAYAARKAYEAAGSTVMPGPIWEVTDDILKEAVNRATKINGYNTDHIRRIAEFVLASSRGDPAEHGASIDRKGMLGAITWTDKN